MAQALRWKLRVEGGKSAWLNLSKKDTDDSSE